MKQILILSGKGGTGKTTIVAAFIELLEAKAFADCDVDAPNLHLVMNMYGQPEVEKFYGMDKAVIDEGICTGCGQCLEHCHFDAIEEIMTGSGIKYKVNPYACEGCSVCDYVCPSEAISLVRKLSGKTNIYYKDVVFSTATLKMGNGNSGKLVSEVKNNMKNKLDTDLVELAVIDGSPGIGCPVIASITGVDLILLVTEPTVSGISDMKRVVEIAEHFKIPIAICTNKYDVNKEKTDEIRTYADVNGLPFVGVVPYDTQVAYATNQGKNIMKVKSKAGDAIIEVLGKTLDVLNK